MYSVYIIRLMYILLIFFFFFFQAEDGIRYSSVTGVQTCALPIFRDLHRLRWSHRSLWRSRSLSVSFERLFEPAREPLHLAIAAVEAVDDLKQEVGRAAGRGRG